MATTGNYTPSTMTVQQAVDTFLEHRKPRVRPRSYETYEFWLARWLRWRQVHDYEPLMKSITLAELQHYFRHMEEVDLLSPASRDATWRVLRALWRLLARRKLLVKKQLDFFDVDGLARISVPDTIQPIYDEDTIRALLSAADELVDEESEKRNKAVIYLLWETGARAEELCTLTDEKTDLARRHGVINGKGGRPRWLRWDDGAADALEAYLEVRSGPEGGALLRNMLDGGPITPNGIRLMLKRLGQRAGVKLARQSTVHAFRRTFAQDCLDGGVSDLDLQQLMGHRSIESTQRYTRRAPQRLDDVYKRVRAEKRRRKNGGEGEPVPVG